MQTNPRLPRSPWLTRTANRLLAPGDVLRKLLFLTLQDRLDMCGGTMHFTILPPNVDGDEGNPSWLSQPSRTKSW
jgi:hypothetical protein